MQVYSSVRLMDRLLCWFQGVVAMAAMAMVRIVKARIVADLSRYGND